MMWTSTAVNDLYNLPFIELLFRAQTEHRKHFDPNSVQLCTLLSVKTGKCPEDCKYCPQSAHYPTGVKSDKLMSVEEVSEKAKTAKSLGATRFCIGAAWRNPPEKQFPQVLEMIKAINNEGLESCATLGMLSEDQAQQLKAAGLAYYNHNLDTSPEFYGEIITTRTYQDRLETLQRVRDAGMQVCCGGIVGMGESREDRIQLLMQLANLEKPPESVPINLLARMPGTPLANVEALDTIEYLRTIAVARLMMPTSYIRLACGRERMSDEGQAMAFMAGANSIFFGDKLLTAPNATPDHDQTLLQRLGIKPQSMSLEEVCA